MGDEYTSIAGMARMELKVQGSRFVASALPARNRTEAAELVAKIRREFHDATHHCFANRLGVDGRDLRANDDGEPAGSAGKPILAAIVNAGLTDVLVVVTRYFGGTKLGIGGLARAYGGAASSVLAAAERVTHIVTVGMRISFPHPLTSNVMHVVSRAGLRILDTSYDEEVHMMLAVRRSLADEICAQLVERTSGNVRITRDTQDPHK
jgi:uncharacterized YigZ family protein